MTSEIFEKVVSYLVEVSDAEIESDKVSRDTTLRQDLDLDSLQSLTMILDLEDHYGISVEEDEIVELNSVGDVIDLIIEKQNNNDG